MGTGTSTESVQAAALSRREAQIMALIAAGHSNGQIAERLTLAEKTVKKHMTNIFDKLGLEGRNAATVRALEVLSGPGDSPAGK